MRELITVPKAELRDIRGQQESHPALYQPDPARYPHSQAFGEGIRGRGDDGLLYDSVRRAGGENVVIFRPRLLVPVLQGDHYVYSWDRHGDHTVDRLSNVA